MKRERLAALIGLAGMALVAGCDRSHQTADGTTQPGAVGSAGATGNGTISATGSPEQGGANGTGPSAVPANATINQLDRSTPEEQAQGKANAAQR